jgi:hypothetical protein
MLSRAHLCGQESYLAPASRTLTVTPSKGSVVLSLWISGSGTLMCCLVGVQHRRRCSSKQKAAATPSPSPQLCKIGGGGGPRWSLQSLRTLTRTPTNHGKVLVDGVVVTGQ